MKKKVIQVYTTGTELKERIAKLRGIYSETVWCHQVLEREVIKLEREKMKKDKRK